VRRFVAWRLKPFTVGDGDEEPHRVWLEFTLKEADSGGCLQPMNPESRRLSQCRTEWCVRMLFSQFKNPICAWPLQTLNNPEAGSRPLLEALMGLGLNGAIVDEGIRTTVVAGKKAIANSVAESLHGALVLKQGSPA
jgi:hypothetical protein